MANNIIKQTNQGIVLEETPVTLTDEKLNGILLRTYEKAVYETTKWHWYKLYSILLSVAGTLFLTLLTSSFNDIGSFEAESIRKIVIGITIFASVLVLFYLGFRLIKRKRTILKQEITQLEKLLKNIICRINDIYIYLCTLRSERFVAKIEELLPLCDKLK